MIEHTTSKIKFRTVLIKWIGITDSEECDVYEFTDIPGEISIHIEGFFNGAIITMKGGNISDAVSATLQEINGDNAVINQEDIFSILDRPQFIKPEISNGLSSVINVHMIVRYIG